MPPPPPIKNGGGINNSVFFFTEKKLLINLLMIMFDLCVEVLWLSQPCGAMSSMVSLPNHTFTGQTKSSKWLTCIVHILSPETDNCPS